MHDIWHLISPNGLPYGQILCTFLKPLTHFEGDPNELVELYKNTTIAAQCGILGPEKDF